MIFENENFFIEQEKSQIPWLKIFTKKEFRELSDLPPNLRNELFDLVLLCEKALIKFYQPEKVNIASFANYVQRVHIHIMARFKEDAFFPECMWGKQQREEKDLNLKHFDEFVSFLQEKLAKNKNI